MGQKTNPIGNRLGYIRGWDSNWYGGRNYGDKKLPDDLDLENYEEKISEKIKLLKFAKLLLQF